MSPLEALGVGFGALGLLVGMRLFYVWRTRIRPLQPSLDLEWAVDCEHLTTATVDGNDITFHMVRDFTWRTTRDRDENWAESVHVRLDELKDVWFIVDHFHALKGLAHTYLTFEFEDGTCLSFSFETRREKGERYHPWDGLWRAYELYLLVGFERDVTGLRTHGRRNKDYMFRAITPPGKDKDLLMGLIGKLNQLAVEPEWYHSLLTTCNTSIVRIVNQVTPGRIPFLWRNFLPGYTPKAAFKLKLIEDWGGLEQTLASARIDERAQAWDGEEDYSAMLRSFLPSSPKSEDAP
ncbi:MAG: DUF4105 domain-containing protein [Candidatus Poseidonia sp.]|nr:DUF4105 domain-containing protein [Poseidonia sp.]